MTGDAATEIAFLGTDACAAAHLSALVGAALRCVVVTPPARRRGRGGEPTPTPVGAYASDHELPLLATASVNTEDSLAWLRLHAPQLLVVVAFGQILRDDVLDIAPLGPLNVHFSLLPRWRGAAPVRRAILAGDEETGVCVQRMVAALDAGPVLAERTTPIGSDEFAPELRSRLTAIGCAVLVDVATRLLAGEELRGKQQDESRATYAKKLRAKDGRLDAPAETATELVRRVRALAASPGCRAVIERRGRSPVPVHVHRAVVQAGAGGPGVVLAAGRGGIVIGARAGTVRLLELQRPGKRVLTAGEFQNGCPLAPGDRFVAPAS